MKYSLFLLFQFAFTLSVILAQSAPKTPIIVEIDSWDGRHLKINGYSVNSSAARVWLAETSGKSGGKNPVLIIFDRKTSIGTISDIINLVKLTNDEVYAILKTESRDNPFVLTSLSTFNDEQHLLPQDFYPLPAEAIQIWTTPAILHFPPLDKTIPPYMGNGEPPFHNPVTSFTVPLSTDDLGKSFQAVAPVFNRNEKAISKKQLTESDRSFDEDFSSETYQFIFFSVLEGLYHDGASQSDVDRLLLQNDKKAYVNFIYACPICMPTLAAIRAYNARPELYKTKLHNYQSQERTLGYGLPPEASKLLQSDDPKQRLQGIYSLVNLWTARKMDKMNLSDDAKTKLIHKLQKARKQGAMTLQSFAKEGTLDSFAPAYSDEDECVICNAAAQMPLKFEGEKR